MPEKKENKKRNIQSNLLVYSQKRAEAKLEQAVEKLSDPAQVPGGDPQLFSMPEAKTVFSDAYQLQYSLRPMVVQKNEDPAMEYVRGLMEQYAQSEEYKSSREQTLLHDNESTQVAAKKTEFFLKELQKKRDELEEKKREEAENERQIEEQIEEQAEPNDVNGKVRNGISKLRDIMNQDVSDTLANMASAIGKGGKNAAHALGMGYSHEETEMSREIIDLAAQILSAHDVEKILTSQKKSQKVTEESFVKVNESKHGEVGPGYRFTHNIQDVLPKELAMPDAIFERKLIMGELESRTRYGITVEGKKGITINTTVDDAPGAYYVLLDISGSMYGEKTVWARSVALAILILARREHRPYYLRFFDDKTYARQSEPDKVMNALITQGEGGGTNINKALATSLRDLRNDDIWRSTNSIVLITDGYDYVDNWKKAFKSSKAKLISIMIDGYNDSLKATSKQFFNATPSVEGALHLIDALEKQEESTN